jgi:hypothetical protein
LPELPIAMLLDPARLERPDVQVAMAPFAFMIAPAQLPEAERGALAADFPRYGCAGFFPYRDEDCGSSIQALVAEMTSPAFADALGERLGLGRLSERPAIVTVSDAVNRRHGTIHTDSKSKIATALLYLNEDWPRTSEGCLRFLHRGDDIEALAAPEIRPVYGMLVAFRRADNSWHGHLPFEGERRVIQVAWLTSAEELERKNRRGRFSRFVKKIAGSLDARWGARRGVNARHD